MDNATAALDALLRDTTSIASRLGPTIPDEKEHPNPAHSIGGVYSDLQASVWNLTSLQRDVAFYKSLLPSNGADNATANVRHEGPPITAQGTVAIGEDMWKATDAALVEAHGSVDMTASLVADLEKGRHRDKPEAYNWPNMRPYRIAQPKLASLSTAVARLVFMDMNLLHPSPSLALLSQFHAIIHAAHTGENVPTTPGALQIFADELLAASLAGVRRVEYQPPEETVGPPAVALREFLGKAEKYHARAREEVYRRWEMCWPVTIQKLKDTQARERADAVKPMAELIKFGSLEYKKEREILRARNEMADMEREAHEKFEGADYEGAIALLEGLLDPAKRHQDEDEDAEEESEDETDTAELGRKIETVKLKDDANKESGGIPYQLSPIETVTLKTQLALALILARRWNTAEETLSSILDHATDPGSPKPSGLLKYLSRLWHAISLHRALIFSYDRAIEACQTSTRLKDLAQGWDEGEAEHHGAELLTLKYKLTGARDRQAASSQSPGDAPPATPNPTGSLDPIPYLTDINWAAFYSISSRIFDLAPMSHLLDPVSRVAVCTYHPDPGPPFAAARREEPVELPESSVTDEEILEYWAIFCGAMAVQSTEAGTGLPETAPLGSFEPDNTSSADRPAGAPSSGAGDGSSTTWTLPGEVIAPLLRAQSSGASDLVLGQIWELADIEADGLLDFDEFCVAMKLVSMVCGAQGSKEGDEAREADETVEDGGAGSSLTMRAVPDRLPPWLIPVSKKHFFGVGVAGV